jgi:uncharacterized protein
MSHRRLTVVIGLTILLLAVNFVAFNHAWAMTHFSDSGSRTATPESLTLAEKLWICIVGVNIPRPTNQVDPRSVGINFETRRFGGEHADELEAWYVPKADAKGLVLLCHGYSASKASLLREANAFHDLGYAALLLDFHGSGGSRGSDTTIGVREAEDVVCAVEYARKNWAPRELILYGQSMGSAAILRAAARHDLEPTAIIVECPFDRLISTAGNRFAAMGLPAFPSAQLLVFWGGVQNGFNGFRHNPAEYAEQVRCPVLLLHGSKDPRVTVEQVRSIFQNLAGEKQFVLFDGVGHESYVGAAPDRWRQAVATFLAKLHAAR